MYIHSQSNKNDVLSNIVHFRSDQTYLTPQHSVKIATIRCRGAMGSVAICCAEEKVNEDVDHETMIAEVAMRHLTSGINLQASDHFFHTANEKTA